MVKRNQEPIVKYMVVKRWLGTDHVFETFEIGYDGKGYVNELGRFYSEEEALDKIPESGEMLGLRKI